MGLEKREHLERLYDAPDIEALRRVRLAFDPGELANRGKVLPVGPLAGRGAGPRRALERPHPAPTRWRASARRWRATHGSCRGAAAPRPPSPRPPLRTRRARPVRARRHHRVRPVGARPHRPRRHPRRRHRGLLRSAASPSPSIRCWPRPERRSGGRSRAGSAVRVDTAGVGSATSWSAPGSWTAGRACPGPGQGREERSRLRPAAAAGRQPRPARGAGRDQPEGLPPSRGERHPSSPRVLAETLARVESLARSPFDVDASTSCPAAVRPTCWSAWPARRPSCARWRPALASAPRSRR